ncbi:MAG: penicillin-insensitive murein endopeptidase [Nannocystales bacterium]
MGSVLRASALAACVAGLSSCSIAHAEEPVELSELEVADPPMMHAMGATIPSATRPHLNLDAVWWTVPRNESLKRLADRWGADDDELRKLNPTLSDEKAEKGERLVVYRLEPGTVSRSVGAPNRGRIENSAPFPDGEGWNMRGYRPRSYATRQTVTQLATSLALWRERYPDANPVKLGEFSRRGGGRVRPHKSHRTGRDVDIGYVMNEPDEGHRFVTVSDDNMDAAATWGLVQQLVAGDAVESIFMAESVQAQLIPFAALSLTEAQQRALFSTLEPDARAKKKTTIRAWRGHDDHMHVRFGCTEADFQCRGAVSRKKKRRRKKKRHKSKRRRSRKR